MASHDSVEFEIDIGMQPKWAQTYDLGQQDGTVRIAADGRLFRLTDYGRGPWVPLSHTGTVKIDVEDDSGEWRELFVTFEAGRMTRKAFAERALNLAGNPAYALRDIAERAGYEVDHEEVERWAKYADEPPE